MQDRVAQPLKDRTLEDVDLAALRQVQVELEAGEATGHATFEVEGMSCMGCAWLVERLASSQPGFIRGDVSLSRHTITLDWRCGQFDLSMLGAELFKFGYRLGAKAIDPGDVSWLSPLALRCVLSLVFTGNALLLAAYRQFVSLGDEGVGMIHLLSLVCLCFTLLLGGSPFFVAVLRAAKIRRVHSDWLPTGLVLLLAGWLGYGVFSLNLDLSWAVFGLSLLIGVLIVARWLSLEMSRIFLSVRRLFS
jgi:Cu2+-exporting ATPase